MYPHFGRSPAALGPAEIRTYQVYLTHARQRAPGSILIAVAALRFRYTVTLQKDGSLEAVIPAPKKPQPLPVVLSPAEALPFLGGVPGLKHRPLLTPGSAAGLRLSEAIRLCPADIDSQRMGVRVQQGQGQKDRSGMLSPKRLERLRAWWRTEKPPRWLFPGERGGQHLSKDALEQACQTARRRCGMPQPITPHALHHQAA